MLGIITFIIIFGILVIVHEFGHFYFAKNLGFLSENLPLVWAPKSFRMLTKKELSTP